MSANLVEVRSFWYILAEKFVGVFDQTFLPRCVRVGKLYRHPVESPGYELVLRELGTVVGGDCKYALCSIGQEQASDGSGQFLSLFAVL